MQNPNSSLREKEIDSEAQTLSQDQDGPSRRSVNKDEMNHDGQIPDTKSPPDAQEELVSSFLPPRLRIWAGQNARCVD